MGKRKALFIGGTSSNAGKSWMTTAVCAWLRQHGVSVAPFKAQNMSNHSYPCRAGGEIGRAQVAQAEACGLEPEVAMNPILLKPTGQGRSQVIVNGQVWKTLAAREYYAHASELRTVVMDAYATLASRVDVVIIEGAGSVSELNLREHDLVNLGLVTRLGVPWMLVADIERGGVIGSVVGSVHLLTAEERALFRGFAINKFRGDVTLFDSGVDILEAQTGSHCFGVFPYAQDLYLDAEDSLAVAGEAREPAPAGAAMAIVRLPHLSNATDFRLLTWADWITTAPAADYDVVILPGTKNTLADLDWLRRTGLAEWVKAQHHRGALVVGVCGGYQMLGHRVCDPHGVESDAGFTDGLGLLPVTTILAAEKRVRTVQATTVGGVRFGGYEIHMGVTTIDQDVEGEPFATLTTGEADGLRIGNTIGTYLHGALEDPAVCTALFGVEPPAVAAKAEHYRRLGDWFESHGRGLERLGVL